MLSAIPGHSSCLTAAIDGISHAIQRLVTLYSDGLSDPPTLQAQVSVNALLVSHAELSNILEKLSTTLQLMFLKKYNDQKAVRRDHILKR